MVRGVVVVCEHRLGLEKRSTIEQESCAMHGESENMESCRKVGQWMLQNVVPYTDIST